MKELEYICGLNGTYTKDLLDNQLLAKGWVSMTNGPERFRGNKYFLTESGRLIYNWLLQRQQMISGITQGGDEADILRTAAIQDAIKSKRGKAKLL